MVRYDIGTAQWNNGTSNVKKKKKKKSSTECDKSMVKSDVGIAQCNNETIKCEKKKRVLLNVTKVQSNVILVLPNVTMKPSNAIKNKGTIKYDKKNSHM